MVAIIISYNTIYIFTVHIMKLFVYVAMTLIVVTQKGVLQSMKSHIA